MALDMNMVRKAQEELQKRGSGNSFFLQKDIAEETDIRILPPLPNLNGLYYIERLVWWINGKKYISRATFGEDCVIEQELAEAAKQAKATKDNELASLVGDKDKCARKSSFLVPILLLDCEFDAEGNATKVTIVGGKPKIAEIGPVLIKATSAVVASRPFQNGTPDGTMDRVKGSNIIWGKTGTGIGTNYTAMGWRNPMEMDAKYYTEIPDVLALTKKELKSNAYLTSVIRNYLYGEPILKDENAQEETGHEEAAETPAETNAAKATPPAVEKPAAKKRGITPATADELPKTEENGGRRGLLGDLQNLG